MVNVTIHAVTSIDGWNFGKNFVGILYIMFNFIVITEFSLFFPFCHFPGELL